MICIIDYDLGNVISVKNAINKIGFKCIISRKDDDILNSKEILIKLENGDLLKWDFLD